MAKRKTKKKAAKKAPVCRNCGGPMLADECITDVMVMLVQNADALDTVIHRTAPMVGKPAAEVMRKAHALSTKASKMLSALEGMRL